MRTRFQRVEYATDEARKRGERVYNRGIHDNTGRIRQALESVAARRIDIELVDWSAIRILLDAIDDAADCLGGGEE